MSEEIEQNIDAKFERESNLQTDDGSKIWRIDSFQRKVIARLRNAGCEPLLVDEKSGRHYFEVDFNQVSFRKKPSKDRKPMSQERKDENAKRLADGREAKKNARVD